MALFRCGAGNVAQIPIDEIMYFGTASNYGYIFVDKAKLMEAGYTKAKVVMLTGTFTALQYRVDTSSTTGTWQTLTPNTDIDVSAISGDRITIQTSATDASYKVVFS